MPHKSLRWQSRYAHKPLLAFSEFLKQFPPDVDWNGRFQ